MRYCVAIRASDGVSHIDAREAILIRFSALELKGSAIGALRNSGVSLVGDHLYLVETAIVLVSAMMCAL